MNEQREKANCLFEGKGNYDSFENIRCDADDDFSIDETDSGVTSCDDTISLRENTCFKREELFPDIPCQYKQVKRTNYEQPVEQMGAKSKKISEISHAKKNAKFNTNYSVEKKKDFGNLREYFSDLRKMLRELDERWIKVEQELGKIEDLRKFQAERFEEL